MGAEQPWSVTAQPAESSIYDDDSSAGSGVVRIASVAALGGFLFGYDSAVINGAVSAVEDKFNADAASLGFAVASALLGAAAGALMSGRIADHIGRLAVMRIAAVLFLVSALGTGLANSLWMLVVFRIVGGLGVGMASVIAPAYIAEISPASIRGRLALAAAARHRDRHLHLAAGGLHLRRGGRRVRATTSGSGWEAWRWMFLAMAVPAVIYGVTVVDDPGVAAVPDLQEQDHRRQRRS